MNAQTSKVLTLHEHLVMMLAYLIKIIKKSETSCNPWLPIVHAPHVIVSFTSGASAAAVTFLISIAPANVSFEQTAERVSSS